jgi:beta-galactosidase
LLETNIIRPGRLMPFLIFSLIIMCSQSGSAKSFTRYLNLNGEWEMGYDRKYNKTVTVPGINTEPSKMDPSVLWFRRAVELPGGDWKYATLELKGARFCPEVYVNGVSVSRKNGGMAPTFHLLRQRDVRPGRKIILEIALKSLKDIPEADASYIPVADQWRSNISSCLWNDVILKLHGECRIDRIVPYTDYNKKETDFSFDVTDFGISGMKDLKGRIEILSSNGVILTFNETDAIDSRNSIIVKYGDILNPWSPENPNLYYVLLSLISGKDTVDQSVIHFGVKDFRVLGKQFYLNNEHITLTGGTVVWHRWVRDSEARILAYDTLWFKENVIERSKEHGANYIRFHLGVPPESLLDLCDKYGLAVQYEWSFFHGMPASRESLMEQYPRWLDMAMRHPSVVLIHPYNETEGDQLDTVWDALNDIVKNYPPLVMEERDVIHIHKYWWSLFENLGLYYDNADQFPKPIMVDEFGGNYLDGNGMPGGYKTSAETFLRFLGRNNTKDLRLELQTLSNGKIAEYWRRIGAAGIAPFCILGSWYDGNHWFMGDLSEGNPKPVWNALTCAWSPRSVSIELWDRNFVPGQAVIFPLYIFNDTRDEEGFNIRLLLTDENDKICYDHLLNYNVTPFTTLSENQEICIPPKPGRYILSAELLNLPDQVKYPVISKWEIHVFKPEVPDNLVKLDLKVASDEPEIQQFLKDCKIRNVPLSDPSAKIMVLSRNGWNRIADGDMELINRIEKAVNTGTSVIILDAGERYLGQGYPEKENDLGPLQGVVTKSDTPVKTYNLFGGIKLSFREAAEPESHIHPDRNNSFLWNNISSDYTWLWNGMRGGLIVPATDFMFDGLGPAAYLEQWLTRGAEEDKIKGEHYYAYELEGFYEFSEFPDNNDLKQELRQRIDFLVQDAPALSGSLNPLAPVRVTNLSVGYRESEGRLGKTLIPMVNAGKNLTRTPVIMIGFGTDKGKIIVSQLLTMGRMAKVFSGPGLYGIRYDPVACQFILNMFETVLKVN